MPSFRAGLIAWALGALPVGGSEVSATINWSPFANPKLLSGSSGIKVRLLGGYPVLTLHLMSAGAIAELWTGSTHYFAEKEVCLFSSKFPAGDLEQRRYRCLKEW